MVCLLLQEIQKVVVTEIFTEIGFIELKTLTVTVIVKSRLHNIYYITVHYCYIRLYYCYIGLYTYTNADWRDSCVVVQQPFLGMRYKNGSQ